MTWLLKPVSFYGHFNQALFQRTIWAPPHTRVHQIPTHITIHIDYGSFTITHTQIQYISKRESSDQSIHSQQSGNLKRYHSNEKWPQSLSGRCWWCSFNDVVLVGFVPSYVCVCVCVCLLEQASLAVCALLQSARVEECVKTEARWIGNMGVPLKTLLTCSLVSSTTYTIPCSAVTATALSTWTTRVVWSLSFNISLFF